MFPKYVRQQYYRHASVYVFREKSYNSLYAQEIITKFATSRLGIQPNNTNSLSVQSHALQNAPMLGRPQGLPRGQGLPVFSHQFLHVHSTTGLRIFGQCIKHCQRQLRCIEHRRKIGHNTSIAGWLRCRTGSICATWVALYASAESWVHRAR